MSREILIQVQKDERLVAIVDGGQLDDFHIEGERYQSLLGNIYKGRVESILPSINAAFVNIGQERNGFLYLTDVVNPLVADDVSAPQKLIDKFLNKPQQKSQADRRGRRPRKEEIPLKEGQEILVQVVKDPFGGKGARLTTHLTLPGRFAVFMPCDKQNGISRKIEDVEERKRLREVIKGFNFAKTGGFIIRTAACQQGKRELIRDARWLYKLWTEIFKKSEETKAPALVYEEHELTLRIVRDYFTEKVDKLVLDSKEEYFKVRKFVQEVIGREMIKKVFCYRGKEPLFESKGIARELKKIYDTKVFSKTGAYIVIEPTEGLIVVDVNSGKFKTKADPGEAAFMVNMEVVPEIARQLRLRDLGGIIVIDFIDMVKEDHKRKILEALQRNLSRDYAKTEVNKISSLGLVEMTRARTGKTIESISFEKCPFCQGRGRVKKV